MNYLALLENSFKETKQNIHVEKMLKFSKLKLKDIIHFKSVITSAYNGIYLVIDNYNKVNYSVKEDIKLLSLPEPNVTEEEDLLPNEIDIPDYARDRDGDRDGDRDADELFTSKILIELGFLNPEDNEDELFTADILTNMGYNTSDMDHFRWEDEEMLI